MGNSKVIFGNETLIDLTGDTVTPDTLLAGTTAHNRSGEQIVGTATVPEELDDLTDITITSAADGDLLQYNGTSGEWENSDTLPNELVAMQEAGAVNRFGGTSTSQVNQGVTFTINDDKSVTLNATNKTGTGLITSTSFVLKAGTYTASRLGTTDSRICFRVCNKVNASIIYADSRNIPITFTLSSDTTCVARIFADGNLSAISNQTIYPMIYDARLVNPPYQPFTMTNRELTDTVEAVDDWEDISSQCTFAHDYYDDTSYAFGVSYGVHVNRKLKLCMISMIFRTNPDSEIHFANSIALLKMPTGYRFTTKRMYACAPSIKGFNETTTGHSLDLMNPQVMAEGRYLYISYSVNTDLYCQRMYIPMITILLTEIP